MYSNASQTYRKLITANHILHHHGVVDAYGHISGILTAWPRWQRLSNSPQSDIPQIHPST